MTERLLQFIWQFQYFNKQELQLLSGEAFTIIQPGQFNTNQGPDFLHATIKIGDTMLAGTVELHLKTSDWNKHAHQKDINYRNVILHVVWINDLPPDAGSIPLLVLHDRVPKLLLNQYGDWMNRKSHIPCGQQLLQVNDLVWITWKERLLVERLIKKVATIELQLQQNHLHWEETFWWLLARNFGIKVNAETFESIARSISVNLLARHKNQIHQLEALLFGQAGLLEKQFSEDYPKLLKREYHFLQKKYDLHQSHKPVLFLRMRPVNFPTIRLAQLAMLVHESSHLFSVIKELNSLKEVKELLHITANDYWSYHYVFDEKAAYKPKKLGEEMINNILINTIIPIVFAYGHFHHEKHYKQKALQWLEETPAEKNSIVNAFAKLGISGNTAFDSQAFIELRVAYCNKKRCLDCAAGNALLKRITNEI